jgi:hypothetical protein
LRQEVERLAPRDREEEEESAACADCGTVLNLDGARSFAFGEQSVLCWACAIRRGGRYDADSESWTAAPRVGDLEAAED